MVFLAKTSPALAGNASYIGILGASEDGKTLAVFQDADGAIGSCGLSRIVPKPSYDPPRGVTVSASCTDAKRQLLPVGKWKWRRRLPEIATLHAFHRDQVQGAPMRVVRDPTTRVGRLEVLQNGRFYPVFVDESGGLTKLSLEERYGSPEIVDPSEWMGPTGFVRLKNGYLIRMYYSRGLIDWDEVLATSDVEVANLAARRSAARQRAAQATRRLRELYQTKSGVFIATPAGPINQIVRKRNRAAAAREAVRLWEVAAGYGALAGPDVRDALWLLAWIDAPTRRLEALRWFLDWRDRDPKAAEASLLELENDAQTSWLAAHLKTARDPLRHLPDVAGTLITDQDLKGVTDEDLRWLHLAQWAAQGGYRFEDPAIFDYFAQFPWYAPIPKSDWPRWRSKSFLKNPDARLLRMDRAATPSGARKESLEAILRAERARGVSPPTPP